MRILLCYICFFSICQTACLAQNNFPVDSSYTILSTYEKIKKHYSKLDVAPVRNIESNKILSLYNQVYKVRNNRFLRMDVFIPNRSENTKYPCVIMVHGGGWRSGNKANLVPLAQKIASHGYVCITVEQRLSIESLYPAAPHDLKEAIRFTKHNSSTYSIDTTKIAILGASSGATMASLMATTGHINKFDDPNTTYPEHSAQVQALINIDGVVDFTTPEESAKDNNAKKPSAGAMFFGATYKERPDLWKEASAINYVDQNTPPTLYINSSKPRFHAGRDKFFEILNMHGIYHDQHTLEGSPHAFWLLHPWFEQTQEHILNFLKVIF